MFAALLDTCVLVPSRARDVLLEVAAQSVYRPLWSEAILAELRRTVELLAIKRGRDAQEVQSYCERLLQQMSDAFPDALVVGWESLENGFTLPDINDRSAPSMLYEAQPTKAKAEGTESGLRFRLV